MKVLRSIKSAKNRHRDCRVVKRKGRLYVINKTDSRFKAFYVPKGKALWCTLQLAGPNSTSDTPIIGAQGGFY